MYLKCKLGVWKSTSRSCHTRSCLSFISQILTVQCIFATFISTLFFSTTIGGASVSFLKQNDHVWSCWRFTVLQYSDAIAAKAWRDSGTWRAISCVYRVDSVRRCQEVTIVRISAPRGSTPESSRNGCEPWTAETVQEDQCYGHKFLECWM